MTEALDSQSTELVLRRALEIAHRQPEIGPARLGHRDLAEIAAELDIPDSALAAALAEQAIGVHDDDNTFLDRLVGPDVIWTQRPATADAGQATEDLVEWLRSGHGLKTRIVSDGTVTATKRKDLSAVVGNAMRSLRGQGGLSDIRRVNAAAIGLDDGDAAICLAADVGDKRAGAVAAGAGVTAATGSMVAVAAIVGGPVFLFAVPVVTAAGVITSRVVHKATVNKVRESVEETADGVARGSKPPSLIRKPWRT